MLACIWTASMQQFPKTLETRWHMNSKVWISARKLTSMYDSFHMQSVACHLIKFYTIIMKCIMLTVNKTSSNISLQNFLFWLSRWFYRTMLYVCTLPLTLLLTLFLTLIHNPAQTCFQVLSTVLGTKLLIFEKQTK